MKTRMILTIATTVALFASGAAYAAGCGSCGEGGKCKDSQAVQQFLQEAGTLRNELKSKELELYSEYRLEGIDPNKVGALEQDIKELKGKIRTVGEKLGFPQCCIS